MEQSYRGMYASEKPRCRCGKFIKASDPYCSDCGPLAKCRCGEFRPIDGERGTIMRLQCENHNTGTGKITVYGEEREKV